MGSRRLFLFLLVLLFCSSFSLWGFYGHRLITGMAIYTLPSEMISFYKRNAELIIQGSVVPDQRRYVIPEEGARHYIDLDDYEHRDSIPKFWNGAIEKYGEDYLTARGIGPWHTYFTYIKLIKAFIEKDRNKIIRLSSDLAHYIADANVPLHTTRNYNGQLTNQHGIHGFWETRLPLLFSNDYDFLVGRAEYLDDPQAEIWEGVLLANNLVDSVLLIETRVTEYVGAERKFSWEESGKSMQLVYSLRYSNEYHNLMPRVEQQMQRSIKMIGDFWFTAWVEAGQPDISNMKTTVQVKDSVVLQKRITPRRQHEH
jgi:hypothetical protein